MWAEARERIWSDVGWWCTGAWQSARCVDLLITESEVQLYLSESNGARKWSFSGEFAVLGGRRERGPLARTDDKQLKLAI